MEYAIPSPRHAPVAQTPPAVAPIHALDELADAHHGHGDNHTFKIVTTKKSLQLCAPSEEEEIRWLSAVRALIARRTVGSKTEGGRRRSISTGLTAAVEEVVSSR